ncbi:ethylene-responsive transcription factor [Tripterygium wilfordii]|uniref:Ethylene-responsive transcription factor n=1 Tax=Tripterygium wilfordii TaxID=458696 RepID=A0A7J7DC29_TRIWF|nr:ethylene-responsive transcription factor [Tripterygium wilfordii]
MTSPDEVSTLELIREHLLADFPSMDNFITNLDLYTQNNTDPEISSNNTPKASTLSNRRPVLNVKLELEAAGSVCGKRKAEEPVVETNKVVKREEVVVEESEPVLTSQPLTPSSWIGVWDCDVKGIFSVPPLSPVSPYPGVMVA